MAGTGPRTADVGSFRRRLVLSAAALSGLAAITLVLAVQLTLAGRATHSVNRLLEQRAAAVVDEIDAATTSTTVRVPDAALDPGMAVYDAPGVLAKGFVAPRQVGAFTSMSHSATQRLRRIDDTYAVLARPFRTPSGASGVVVLAERLAPYEDDEHDALVVSVVGGLLLFLVATGLASWAGRRALAPVAQMARTAEGWSEHDLARRFDLGPGKNEIRSLGRTLDGLLGKVERTITAEQRLTSELAHELRTPMTAMHATAQLMGSRTDLDAELREEIADIVTSCRQMAATVTSLLSLARSQSSAQDEESCDARRVIETVSDSLDDPGRVSVTTQGPVRLAMPADLAARAFAPVLDIALQHARLVTVVARTQADRVIVSVSDQSGHTRGEVAWIFEGWPPPAEGSGLGLALSRRIARSVGGDVRWSTGGPDGSTGGGAGFDVVLPAVVLRSDPLVAPQVNGSQK